MHKSGFVNIIGHPNVGKSTLLNALIGERLSIITDKPQTTRHRIIAIINTDSYQVVFSDTPGLIDEPNYKMQSAMNTSALSALEDADVLLLMLDASQLEDFNPSLLERIGRVEVPIFLVINKIDLSSPEEVQAIAENWSGKLKIEHVCAISALKNFGTRELLGLIVKHLPEGPPYYPKDQFTDRSERFFISEIIREKILELYHQEIPYSCEVIVHHFQEKSSKKGKIIHISADIIVNRKSQKSILIGKEGRAIKKLGTKARLSIEAFLEKAVFLDLHVKVKEKWRDDERTLKSYGYLQ